MALGIGTKAICAGVLAAAGTGAGLWFATGMESGPTQAEVKAQLVSAQSRFDTIATESGCPGVLGLIKDTVIEKRLPDEDARNEITKDTGKYCPDMHVGIESVVTATHDVASLTGVEVDEGFNTAGRVALAVVMGGFVGALAWATTDRALYNRLPDQPDAFQPKTSAELDAYDGFGV